MMGNDDKDGCILRADWDDHPVAEACLMGAYGVKSLLSEALLAASCVFVMEAYLHAFQAEPLKGASLAEAFLVGVF